MFSLCPFVLVPTFSFSSSGYFLSLVFIFLCLKTAILFLLILCFSHLTKQALLFIFHEEKVFRGSSFAVPFPFQIHWSIMMIEHFFHRPLGSRMGKVLLCSPLLPSSTVFTLKLAFSLPAKITNCIWNLEWFQLKSSLNHVKGHSKTPTDFCCFRNIISLSNQTIMGIRRHK